MHGSGHALRALAGELPVAQRRLPAPSPLKRRTTIVGGSLRLLCQAGTGGPFARGRMGMSLLLFLMAFPLAAALCLLTTRHPTFRGCIVKASALVMCVASILLLAGRHDARQASFLLAGAWLEPALLAADVVLAGYILYQGLRWRRWAVVALVLAQVALTFYFDAAFGAKAAHSVALNLMLDNLSIVMALIIGIVGGMIADYSVPYMQVYHARHHPEVRDRQTLFVFLFFVFFSAMYGIVFANDLRWLSFFWEVTTLCSFLLIGYSETDEARASSFRALELNLVGGLAFAAAILFLGARTGVVEMSRLPAMGQAGVLLPATLLGLAGITKAAQYPFCSWLLGAMVAPTPVSALLHSSTMVKAGVYLIIRMAPIYQGTAAGFDIALIGAVTFLIASCIAIAQSDAKRVLAYSTIANLGLVVMCGGIGTSEAIWAGILLIIFHAISKALLFLCVGAVEQRIKTRSIEDMSGLVVSLPRLAVMMLIGMAGMFLAPFGMLISKWAVLRAVVDCHPILAGFLVFGSAATLFFCTKWMGKLISDVDIHNATEKDLGGAEMGPLVVLAGLTIAVCALFPLVSGQLIEPYIQQVYAMSVSMSSGNIIIMISMLVVVMLFPLALLYRGGDGRVTTAYLGGVNTRASGEFTGAAGATVHLEMRNYYMEEYFGEKRLSRVGIALGILLAMVAMGAALL
jgi:ech hydrogenase subunit A